MAGTLLSGSARTMQTGRALPARHGDNRFRRLKSVSFLPRRVSPQAVDADLLRQRGDGRRHLLQSVLAGLPVLFAREVLGGRIVFVRRQQVAAPGKQIDVLARGMRTIDGEGTLSVTGSFLFSAAIAGVFSAAIAGAMTTNGAKTLAALGGGQNHGVPRDEMVRNARRSSPRPRIVISRPLRSFSRSPGTPSPGRPEPRPRSRTSP